MVPELATALLALVLYHNTWDADFAYDDSRAILKNQDLQQDTPLTDLFFDDFWGTPLTHSGSHKSYRPLCVISFRINHFFGGLNPWGYHFTNTVLHAVVTALFTYTAGLFLQRTSVKLLAGLLFASHPIHTEAVAGVVGRADVGACLFFLLSFLSYTRYCRRRDKTLSKEEVDVVKWLWLLFSVLCTTASMLTKEQGITVLAVNAVYDVFVCSRLRLQDLIPALYKEKHRNVREGVLSTVACGVLLLGFRVYFMGNKPPEFAPSDNPASDSDSFLARTLTFNLLPSLNMLLLLYPRLLSFDWSMDAIPLVESVWDVRNLCTLTFYLTLAVVAVHCITEISRTPQVEHKAKSNGVAHNAVYGNGISEHKHSPSSRKQSNNSSPNSSHKVNARHSTETRSLHVLLLSVAIMVFPFIPASNLFFYVGFVIAERVLYIPSMGFCLLVAEGTHVLYETAGRAWRKVVVVATVMLVVVYSARTVVRNEDWHDEEALYRSGIKVNPAKAWGNLANILKTQGNVDEAEQAYRNALQHRGNMGDVHYNLGILLQEGKRYPEAIQSYQMAIQCRPRLAMAHLNLGIVLSTLGRTEEAEKVYRHAATLDDHGLKDPKAHATGVISAIYNLGRLQHDQGRYSEAIDTYMEAIRRRPSHYAPQSLYNMLGESLFKNGQLPEAEDWFKKSLTAKPDHVPAHLTYAKLMAKTNRAVEAEQMYQKAMELDSNSATVHQHYGQYMAETGRSEEAADMMVKAVELGSPEFETIFNAANALRQAGRHDDAEKYYKQATQLKPEVASAHMNLGAILHLNGKYVEAETSYLRALELKPDDTMTMQNLKKLRTILHKQQSRR
ncbi:protein O-mannosyl-transferase TMTC2-like [Branchiostoma floridae x Branchiostoma belcheri]